MTALGTLSDFFRAAGAAFRVYDLGRRIHRIEPRPFTAFERAELAYPYPFDRAAWLGLLFWPRGRPEDPLIWFLKFPLDEQGLLLQAGRDYVLRRILEAYGGRLFGGSESTRSALEGNPFVFRPPEARLALFRARSARDLARPPSRYYARVRAYLGGALPASAWPSLGIQGIADVAVRLDEDGNLARVSRALPDLAPQPLHALCESLESVRVPGEIARALGRRARPAAARGETQVLASLVRAVGWARAPRVSADIIDMALASRSSLDIEVLAALSGRGWEQLQDPSRMRRFLGRLAANRAGQTGFDALASDLLFLPGMRASALRALREAPPDSALGLRARTFLQRAKGGAG